MFLTDSVLLLSMSKEIRRHLRNYFVTITPYVRVRVACQVARTSGVVGIEESLACLNYVCHFVRILAHPDHPRSNSPLRFDQEINQGFAISQAEQLSEFKSENDTIPTFS